MNLNLLARKFVPKIGLDDRMWEMHATLNQEQFAYLGHFHQYDYPKKLSKCMTYGKQRNSTQVIAIPLICLLTPLN